MEGLTCEVDDITGKITIKVEKQVKQVLSWISGYGWDGNSEVDFSGLDPVVSKDVNIKFMIDITSKEYIISTAYVVNDYFDIPVMRAL